MVYSTPCVVCMSVYIGFLFIKKKTIIKRKQKIIKKYKKLNKKKHSFKKREKKIKREEFKKPLLVFRI